LSLSKTTSTEFLTMTAKPVTTTSNTKKSLHILSCSHNASSALIIIPENIHFE
jgi:hypothetical protein